MNPTAPNPTDSDARIEARPEAKFSELWWDFLRAREVFEDSLLEVLGGDFDNIGTDDYDSSLEIYAVDNHVRLSEAAQRLICDAGFGKVFVNHKDGWETHYTWDWRKPFKAERGWRRRYVSDPDAKTTNVVSGPPNPGYFEISHWPDGWNNHRLTKDWLSSGYMRVVGDPLSDGAPTRQDAAPEDAPRSAAQRRDDQIPPNGGTE